jgi:hypothetical protein
LPKNKTNPSLQKKRENGEVWIWFFFNEWAHDVCAFPNTHT